MMLEPLTHWEKLLNEFFNLLEQQLREQVKTLFDEHFSKWKRSELFHTAWKIVEELLNLNFHQLRTTLADESLNDELCGPYIFQKDIFEGEKAVVLECYNHSRFEARLKVYKREREQRTGQVVSPQEVEKVKKDAASRSILSKEPYHVELDVVAQVCTYYVIAARHFHDAICMRTVSKFYKQLRSQLRDELENGLGLNDKSKAYENAIRLLAQPPHREQQRKELVGMKNVLLQGQQILHDLEQKKFGDNVSSQAFSTGMMHGSGDSSYGLHTPLDEEV